MAQCGPMGIRLRRWASGFSFHMTADVHHGLKLGRANFTLSFNLGRVSRSLQWLGRQWKFRNPQPLINTTK